MKIALTPLLIASFISAPVLANTLEGHRVGLGFNKTDVEDSIGVFSDEYSSNGLKLEYGYDFNNIVGMNVSVGKGSGDFHGTDFDASTFKMDADIGYAFDLTDFTVKPYGAIGYASHKEEHLGGDWKDSNIFLGFGARAYIGNHFYSDLRFDFINLKDGSVNSYVDQLSFTVGYKF
ncbi:porin family protein [Vibrio kyushuensis]|uniref:porin family protein n=1 Tax=Vibrio TaxID=662 RepID=UPI003D0F3C78